MADMKQNTGFGLLSEYGLDLGEESDVRAKLRQQRIAQAMQMVPQQDPRMDPQGQGQAFGRLGAALGNAFGEKKDPKYGMPPEIAARLKTTQEIKDGFERWQSANPEASATDRTDKYHEILATSAMRNGLTDIGVQALQTLEQKRKMREKQDMELEGLGLDLDRKRRTNESNISRDLVENAKAGIVEFYPTNSRDPNASRTGAFNPADQSVTDASGKVWRLGEWKTGRPQLDPRTADGRGGRGSRTGITPTEAGVARNKFTAAAHLQQGYLDVMKQLDLAMEEGVGPVTGKYGRTLSFVNGWVQFVEGLSTAASPTGKMKKVEVIAYKPRLGGLRAPERVVYDMNNPTERERWLNDNRDELRKTVDGWFPGLAKKAEHADRIISMFTDLAYAKAMTSENGATRSLSDLDFKVNFRAIGADIGNSDQLVKHLIADADRVHERMLMGLSVYKPEVQDDLIARTGWERLAHIRAQFVPYRQRYKLGEYAQKAAPTELPPAPAGISQDDWAKMYATMSDEDKALFNGN